MRGWGVYLKTRILYLRGVLLKKYKKYLQFEIKVLMYTLKLQKSVFYNCFGEEERRLSMLGVSPSLYFYIYRSDNLHLFIKLNNII